MEIFLLALVAAMARENAPIGSDARAVANGVIAMAIVKPILG